MGPPIPALAATTRPTVAAMMAAAIAAAAHAVDSRRRSRTQLHAASTVSATRAPVLEALPQIPPAIAAAPRTHPHRLAAFDARMKHAALSAIPSAMATPYALASSRLPPALPRWPNDVWLRKLTSTKA